MLKQIIEFKSKYLAVLFQLCRKKPKLKCLKKRF